MKLLVRFLTLTLGAFAVSGGVDHAHDGHDHELESCACKAQELGFNIDCSQRDLLLTALSTLQANQCDIDCSPIVCHKNFLIVQSHHDFCLHDEVPGPVEDAFHDFEDACGGCKITKKRDPDLLDCPAAVCDNRGDRAYQVLLTSGCLDDCSTSVCASNYQILRAEHDLCDHDKLSESSETGIHDFEEICAAFGCNVLTDESLIAAQLVCITDESSGCTSSYPVEMLATTMMTGIVLSFIVALA